MGTFSCTRTHTRTYPYLHPAGFSGQNKPQIIQNGQVLSKICSKQSNWSYPTQYLTVLDDLGLVLKLTGTEICTHTHTRAKTRQKPAGYPYLCPSLAMPTMVWVELMANSKLFQLWQKVITCNHQLIATFSFNRRIPCAGMGTDIHVLTAIDWHG